jgi:shikimate kinase
LTRRNIYLAGFMGTGKSTVGRELARLMGRKFIDTDHALEKQLGMTVNEIFALNGEAFFRERERELSMELATKSNRVVATGGGTLLDADVRRVFAETGLVICLFTNNDQLVTRLERTDKRPMLKGEDLRNRVEELLTQRQAIYDSITLRVDTTNLTPQQAAHKIYDLLKLRVKLLDELQDQYIVIT